MYELFYSAQQRNILDKSNVDENINNQSSWGWTCDSAPLRYAIQVYMLV